MLIFVCGSPLIDEEFLARAHVLYETGESR